VSYSTYTKEAYTLYGLQLKPTIKLLSTFGYISLHTALTNYSKEQTIGKPPIMDDAQVRSLNLTPRGGIDNGYGGA